MRTPRDAEFTVLPLDAVGLLDPSVRARFPIPWHAAPNARSGAAATTQPRHRMLEALPSDTGVL